MKILNAIPLIVFAALVLLFATGLTLNPKEIPSPLVGRPMPSFSVPSLSDKQQRLSSEDVGHGYSLLNVWASWCSQCRREHSLLMAIAKENAVPIFGLNYKDSPQQAIKVLNQTGDPYIANGIDVNGAVGLEYGVYGVPETFLINEAGEIVFKHVGALTKDIYEQKIIPKIGGRRDAG